VEQLGNKIAHDLALLSARRRVAEPCLKNTIATRYMCTGEVPASWDSLR